MKILIFSNMYPTKDKPQFGIYVFNQVTLLNEMDFECKVISLKTKGNKVLRYISFVVRAMYYSLIKGGDYEIVHAHYAFPPGIFALLHKKRYLSKMVVTVHGSDIYRMPSKSSIIDKWIKKILSKSDATICVSDKLREKVVNLYGIEDRKLHVLNMGIRTDIFQKGDKSLAREELDLPMDKTIILFVGNLYAKKGIKDLIEAFQEANISNKNLILIGDSTVDKEIKQYLAGVKDGNIKIISPKDQPTINKYMNGADVFVIPSYSEGLNLVTLEAMATETIVVTSDIEAFDYLDEDIVIKAKVGNVEGLKNSLEKAVSLLSTSEKYTQKGLKLVDEYRAEDKAKEMARIYRMI